MIYIFAGASSPPLYPLARLHFRALPLHYRPRNGVAQLRDV